MEWRSQSVSRKGRKERSTGRTLAWRLADTAVHSSVGAVHDIAMHSGTTIVLKCVVVSHWVQHSIPSRENRRPVHRGVVHANRRIALSLLCTA